MTGIIPAGAIIAAGLSAGEGTVLQALVDSWNAYIALPVQHPSDRAEFAKIIRDAQARVLMRPARQFLNEATR